MKTHHLILISIVFFFSCNDQKDASLYSNSTTETGNNFEIGLDNASESKSEDRNKSSKQLKLYKIKNEQFGMLFGVMPIPNSWNILNNSKDNILFEAENGVKVYGERYNSFFYSNNQELNYFYQQNGNQVKAPKDITRVINEDLKPFFESKGLKLLDQFPLSQLAQADKQLDNALFKSIPENKTFECIVTEWEDQNGIKVLGVIRYFSTSYPTAGGMNWGYVFNGMEAPKAVYEEAKKDYINALLNLQVNPNWIQKNNQFYAQKSQQSNANHQQRMAAIRAQGQSLINTGKTYSSISDSNHESWKRRNAMTDAGHAKSVDAIWERSNLNDQNGNQYQVDGYYNTVWMNSNNEYFGTNNTNWNPNVDNATNGINWEQLEHSDDN
ncbi:hypothetical protein [Psychroserpens mesophilus]|uniref:hypothetical protein n=1 Tax=Psychroserpens mesophilus TaxID=325473 RepID=UPI00058DB4A7|nr:hypothetical protein [Psychroserpens mesophilus]